MPHAARLALVTGFAVALAASAATRPAAADQSDPRLEGLFKQLKAAPDPDRANEIDISIWQIWYQSHDPEIDQLIAIGTEAMDNGDLQAALIAFDKIVKKKPDFAEGWNRRATVEYLMKDYKASLADIAETLKREPRHFGALSGLGLVNMALDREEQAAEAYRKVLELDPQNEGAKHNLEAIEAQIKKKSI